VFGGYARVYDWLYEDKDYQSEADFVLSLANVYASQPVKSVLDLGCGTGGHALPLAERGMEVTGVDCSPAMLELGRTKAEYAGCRAEFVEGDIQSVRLGRQFSLAIAMFAVMGYQTTNAALQATLATVREHLVPGGVFIFDVWFGPAVLSQRPAPRFKEVQHGSHRIMRFSQPDLDLLSQIVTVEFRIMEFAGARLECDFHETHQMRFFFPQELKMLLMAAGLEFELLCPFMEHGRETTERDWSTTVVARLQP